MHRMLKTTMAVLILMLAIPAMSTDYISTWNGSLAFSYDGDVNAVFPDPVGYGDFLTGTCDYAMTLDFPAVGEEYDWFIAPQATVVALLLGQIPIELQIDEDGVRIYMMGDLQSDLPWSEFGYTWLPGYGLYVASMVTPEDAFPADPDRLLGIWDNDHDWDGTNDVAFNVTGAGGIHHVDGVFSRSMTWAGANGTGLLNEFATWLDENIPGLPTDLLYDSDLSFFAEFDSFIYAFGGPVPGADIVGEGAFSAVITATETITATEETSWSAIKGLY